MAEFAERLPVGTIAIGLLLGLVTNLSAAAPAFPSGSSRLYTKWLPGESKPDPTSPTALLRNAAPTTPSAGLFSSLPTTAPAPALVAPTVRVRSFLDPDKRRFHLDEPVHLLVDLTWSGDVADLLPEAPEEPTLINLSKKAMVLSSRVLPQSGSQKVLVTYHYELTPAAEGAASVEPIEIRYRLRGGGDVLHLTTDRFALTILPRRWPWNEILMGTLGLLAVLGGGTAAGMGMAARARRLRKAANVPPPPSPFDLMKADLNQVRRLLTEGVVKDAYDAVERFVRKALGERLGGDLRHVTISELAERLANEELDAAVRDQATAILDRCAQVKFAGYVPTVADQDQILADCRLLLEDLTMNDER